MLGKPWEGASGGACVFPPAGSSHWQGPVSVARNPGLFGRPGLTDSLTHEGPCLAGGVGGGRAEHHIRACSGEVDSLNNLDGSLVYLGQKPPGRRRRSPRLEPKRRPESLITWYMLSSKDLWFPETLEGCFKCY